MKKIALLAFVVGIVGMVISISLDTTVGEGSRRVHNIGLMNEKQNLLLLFALVTIVGAILYAAARLITSNPNAPTRSEMGAEQIAERSCPFCAETIKARAVLCRYCGQKIDPLPEYPAPLVTSATSALVATDSDEIHEPLTGSNSTNDSKRNATSPIQPAAIDENTIDLDAAWARFTGAFGRGPKKGK